MSQTLTEQFEKLQELLETLRTGGESFASEILLSEVATGSNIPDSDLTKINKYTRTEQEKDNLYTFPVLMIDEAPTRNMVVYTPTSQKKSVNGWKGTTYLFNSKGTSTIFGQPDHALQASSQVARIYDARVVETPKGLIGTLGKVYTVKGTHETDSFITKVDGGILKEVSIHVAVPDGVQCSVCNDSFSNCKDNSGDYHYPGDRVDNKGKLSNSGKNTVYMSTGSGVLVPLELSSVACPGSVNAHILQDDEVEGYKVVSLREALGGSREVLRDIPSPPKEKIVMDQTQARAKLLELAAAAGVTLAEAVSNPANKEFAEIATFTEDELKTEAKTCPGCPHPVHTGKECTNEECECDGPASGGSTQNSDPVFSIFEGDCPVCNRSGDPKKTEQTDTETIATIRTSAQTAIQQVVEGAKVKIEEIKAENAANNEKAKLFDQLFADLCTEVADLAVKNGVKTEIERKAYSESLLQLSYSAVREIQKAYSVTSNGSTRKEQVERITETMAERSKRLLGTTRVETKKDGTKGTTSATIPTRRLGK